MVSLNGLKNGNWIIGKVQIKNPLKIKIFGWNWIAHALNIELLGNGLSHAANKYNNLADKLAVSETK